MKLFLNQTRCRFILIIIILCSILLGSCTPANNYPVIKSLQIERHIVTPSSTSEIKCIASDPDGDSLTYTWSATGGAFSGTGPITDWIAPDTPGTYTIKVTVADSNKGEATEQLIINVRVNHPPVIDSLIAESPEVEQAKSTAIECIAHDPDGDEISYVWTATGGNVFGQGSEVTWIAPNTCGDYSVVATVQDDLGGEDSKEISIKVTKPG